MYISDEDRGGLLSLLLVPIHVMAPRGRVDVDDVVRDDGSSSSRSATC